MGLPEKCPLDEKSSCKGKQCHLFHVGWRTREANCIIGYGSSRKTISSNRVILDTYIENTKIKLGRDICNPDEPDEKTQTDFQKNKPDVQPDKRFEKVTLSNKNTTGIESQSSLKETSTTYNKVKKDRA